MVDVVLTCVACGVWRYRAAADGAAGGAAGGRVGAGGALAATRANGRVVRRVPVHGYLCAGRHPVLGPLHPAVQARQTSPADSLRPEGSYSMTSCRVYPCNHFW